MNITTTTTTKFKKMGLIPVFSLDNIQDIDPLLEIFQKVGIECIEVTFRNTKTPELLQKLKENYPEFCYGVGTVRSVENLKIAFDTKAKFIVTPGFSEPLAQKINDMGIEAYFPGINSTFGMEKALEYGLTTLKFFPAEVSGGIGFLKAMKGPYPDVQFIPTGGIHLGNLADYLKLPNVLAVGGSFLAPSELIKHNQWEKINDVCKEAVQIYKSIRGE
ncbi:MAG: bifunctional 4-hydroxy-2-oxoglutarate aldolase/2-dehydro-3-deoxy-phosphogluconate aldolase [Promethearchaeota archaeon]